MPAARFETTRPVRGSAVSYVMKPPHISVLVADNHPAICAGVRHALSSCPSVSVSCSTRSAETLARTLENNFFDVLVSEFITFGGRASAASACLDALRRRYPTLNIVVLTRLENAGVVHSMMARGVQCIVSKADELSHLLPAISRAHAGGRYLSPRISALAQSLSQGRSGMHLLTAREQEVLRLFLSGMTINEIAAQLDRSKKTISTQKINAMLKLGLQSDLELLRYGLETGLAEA